MRKEERRMKLFAFFMAAVLFIFSVVAISIKNYEIAYYNALFFPLILVIYWLHKKIRLRLAMFVLLFFVIIADIIGCTVHISGVRVHDLTFGFIGYDNIIHFFAAVVMTLMAYNLIHPYLKPHGREYNFYTFFILLFMVAGFGTIIEIAELLAVVFLNAKGVGDYMNNAVDLVFNLLGAIFGAAVIIQYRKNRVFKEITLENKPGQ